MLNFVEERVECVRIRFETLPVLDVVTEFACVASVIIMQTVLVCLIASYTLLLFEIENEAIHTMQTFQPPLILNKLRTIRIFYFLLMLALSFLIHDHLIFTNQAFLIIYNLGTIFQFRFSTLIIFQIVPEIALVTLLLKIVVQAVGDGTGNRSALLFTVEILFVAQCTSLIHHRKTMLAAHHQTMSPHKNQ